MSWCWQCFFILFAFSRAAPATVSAFYVGPSSDISCGFNCRTMMTNTIEDLFMGLLTICLSTFCSLGFSILPLTKGLFDLKEFLMYFMYLCNMCSSLCIFGKCIIFYFILCNFFCFHYTWFSVFCQFSAASLVTQSHIHVCILFSHVILLHPK